MNRMLLLITFISLIILFQSCSQESDKTKFTQAPPPSGSLVRQSSPIGVWSYPGGDGPPMTMTFNADGTVIFKGGGFEECNPSYWNCDDLNSELILRVPNSQYLPDKVIRSMIENHSILRFDHKTNSFYYRFPSRIESICFAGWYFSREK